MRGERRRGTREEWKRVGYEHLSHGWPHMLYPRYLFFANPLAPLFSPSLLAQTNCNQVSKKKVERNHQLFNFMTTRFLGTRCYKSMLTSLMCNSGENVCKELGWVGRGRGTRVWSTCVFVELWEPSVTRGAGGWGKGVCVCVLIACVRFLSFYSFYEMKSKRASVFLLSIFLIWGETRMTENGWFCILADVENFQKRSSILLPNIEKIWTGTNNFNNTWTTSNHSNYFLPLRYHSFSFILSFLNICHDELCSLIPSPRKYLTGKTPNTNHVVFRSYSPLAHPFLAASG